MEDAEYGEFYDDGYGDGQDDMYDMLDDYYRSNGQDNNGPSSSTVGAQGTQGTGTAESVTKEGCFRKICDTVSEVCQITCLSPDSAYAVLRTKKFLPSEAESVFFEDEKRCLARCGIPAELARFELGWEVSESGGECDICCAESGPGELRASSYCHHLFCNDCWSCSILASARDRRWMMACPQNGCTGCVGVELMLQLYGSTLTSSRPMPSSSGVELSNALPLNSREGELFGRMLVSDYVENHPRLRHCPNPKGCEAILVLNHAAAMGEEVVCGQCATHLCFQCGDLPHQPATCEQLREWQFQEFKGGASMALILKSTKPCPECHANVEKNGGCNHMTCRCSHEFCWVCMKPWSLHGSDYFTCPNAKITSDAAMEKNDETFMYYFARYVAQKDSMVADLALLDRVAIMQSSTLRAPQSAGGGVVETSVFVALLERMRKTIKEARLAVAYGYIARYYSFTATSKHSILDHRCVMLEGATEELSKSFQTIGPMNVDVTQLDHLLKTTKQWLDVVMGQK